MSTPQGWQAPKTNWDSKDPVGVSDLNRMEGNPLAIETGERTLDPAQAPTGNVGSLGQILSWFANRIKAIMGTANWWDAPSVTLKGAKGHIDATSVHGATSAATASRIIIRDSNGRAKVASPNESDDIARKAEVDAVDVRLKLCDRFAFSLSVNVAAGETQSITTGDLTGGTIIDLYDAFSLVKLAGSFSSSNPESFLIVDGAWCYDKFRVNINNVGTSAVNKTLRFYGYLFTTDF